MTSTEAAAPPPDPQHVREVFDVAAELEPADRDAFLAAACGGDAALHREVLALLAGVAAPTIDALPPGAPRPPPPRAIGRFAVLGKLGEGGMGVVYRGRDHALDRDVALKLVNHRGGDDARLRLLREAQAMARVAHPNVVPVYEVGEHGEQVFVAMELVRGANLTRWLRRAPRTWRDVVRVLVEAGRGLAAAHRAGVLHRDVKPDNVLIGDDGRARIADFGLARADVATAGGVAATTPDDDGGSAPTSGERRALALELTHDGAVVGSPGFMSPEHFGGAVNAASDQWSLAATAYYAVFHALPFPGRDLAALRDAVLTATAPRPPAGGDVPRAVVDAILRGLERRPEDRFATVDELVDVLAAALAIDPASDHTRFRRQRRGLAIAIAVGGSIGFLAAGIRSGFTFDLPVRWALVSGMIGFALLAGIVYGFRRALWGTTYDRRVSSHILITLAAMLVHRALEFHGDLVVVFRTDAVIAIALLLVGVATVERWFALSAAMMSVFLALSLFFPAITIPAFNLTLVGTIAIGIWFWREPRDPRLR